MIANIIKVALRNIFRKFGYTFINVAGLSIGLACSILIFLYVVNELTYERFHEKADQIYRIGVRGQMPGNELNMVITAAPMMETLIRDYPEVENATRFRNSGSFLVRRGEMKFQETEETFIYADSGFFEIFSFPLIKGDPSKVLNDPRSLVLSDRYAKKYFGDEEPLGQTLRIERDTNLFTVTGIMEDVPINSHFHFEMVGAMSTISDSRNSTWLSHNYYTYVQLAPGSNIEKFTAGINEIVIKYIGPELEQFMGVSIEQFEESGNTFGYFTQPITDIHLHSNLQYEVEANGNPVYVYIFLIIAILILIIACINFMNLATARSITRAREVGLRKVVGSSRSLLISQFLAESLLLSLISLLVAILLVYLTLPFYNNMIRLNLAFDIIASPFTIPLLLGLAIFVGLIAGSYPAFVLASFQPKVVFKGELQAGSSRSILRSLLVVLQFSVAIIILLGTLVANRQLNYMQNKELGFEKENGLVIRHTNVLGDRVEAFKQDLKQHSNIVSVSNSTHIPGVDFSNNVHWLEGEDMSNTILLWSAFASYDYDEALDLNIIQGRFFSREMPMDSSGVVINESAVRSLNLEDPLSKRFFQPGNTPEDALFTPIIGVVEDFHFASMHDEIHPMIFHFLPGNFGEYTVLRLGNGDVQETIRFARQSWEKFQSEYPFEYTWLDDEFDRLFEPEKRTGNILLVFSILSILISCLGLFGLISYSTNQRTKEIGIRKSMGASVRVVMVLLQKETLLLLSISAALAIPAYFGVRNWLQNFAYHIDFNIWVFLVFLMTVSLVVLIIAVGTVSYKSYRAATANPADSLRVE
jgi:putative ABC transport system permease protein